MPFKIRTASIATGDGTDINGKQKALQYFYDNKESDDPVNLKLLLDRDYDFILEIDEKEADIFYYDFYELENYLFDIETLRAFFLSCYINSTFQEEEFKSLFEEIINFDISENLLFLYYLFLYRELHFHNKTPIKMDKIVEYSEFIKKINYGGILNGKDPMVGDGNLNERISSYIKNNLDKIEIGLFDDIVKFIEEKSIERPDTFLRFCQFYFKGKILLNKFSILIKLIGKDTHLKYSNNIIDLLLNNLIFHNKNFEAKISSIEASF
ncbi:hypothetical protein [Enterococcus lactis]